MPVQIKIKRSSVSKRRPAANTAQAGELALNFADKMLSYQDASGVSHDLIPITFYSDKALYKQNEVIFRDGKLLKAKADFTAAKAFDANDWDAISGAGPQGVKGDKGDKGDSVHIVGSDTAANILAKTGATKGDVWIATTDDATNSITAGDGVISDGAGNWKSIGQMRGIQGIAGVNSLIRGSDTQTNIEAKAGQLGDVWIATDGAVAGFGFISDGQGAGAAHWKNIGQVRGPKGEQGDGTRIVGSDTYAHIKAKTAATLKVGDIYISTTASAADGVDVGDGIAWDGKAWNNVGQLQGPMGASIVIQGHDTYANIVAKQGSAGDLWIASADDTASGTDRGDGFLSDGSTGTGQWTNIGPIEGPVGPRGVKGDKGDQGDSVTIKGSDTYANIIAKTGAVGDIWVATNDDTGASVTAGDGLISDGGGSGATHWTNVGQIRGPQGVKGDKGDQGDGYRVTAAKDPAVAYTETPNKGDIIIASVDHTATNVKAGDGLVYDGSGTAGASHWTNIGQLKGPKGDQGDKGDSYRILGSDTLANIQAKSGKQGDIWIATDGTNRGHGYMSDGGGTGATHWIDVGQLQGDQGDSITIKGNDDYATIIAKTSGNTVGDIWITDTDSPTGGTGVTASANDGLLWDGTQWQNIGQIRGAKGDPGTDGADGAVVDFDATETYAADDLVYHGGRIFRAKAAVAAGAWDRDEWEPITYDVDKLYQTTGVTAFYSQQAYNKDDLVVHNGAIYKAKAAVTAGPWDANNWEEIGAKDPHPIDNFDATAAYAQDDIVIHDGKLYRANAAITAGAFNSAEWTLLAPIEATLPIFSDTATYAADDVVLHDGDIYRAKAAITAGPWTASQWDRLTWTGADLISGIGLQTFYNTNAYPQGTLVSHDGSIYRAKAAVAAGTWDVNDWEEIAPAAFPIEEFDDTKPYSIFDLVIHAGAIFRAIKMTVPAGAWDATQWERIAPTASDIPDGGTTGQVLAKQSATDGDIGWEDPESGPISEFDTSVTYNTDDIVLRNGNLYRATAFASATAGSWVSNVWTQITAPVKGGLQKIDMTGQATATLDCSIYDTFELRNINNAITVTINNIDDGMTIVIVTHGGDNGITFTDTILWPGGTAPTFTAGIDVIVVTKASVLVGTTSTGMA